MTLPIYYCINIEIYFQTFWFSILKEIVSFTVSFLLLGLLTFQNPSLFYLPLVYTKPCVSTSKLAIRIFNQGVHHMCVYIYILSNLWVSTNVNILCHTLFLVLLEVL